MTRASASRLARRADAALTDATERLRREYDQLLADIAAVESDPMAAASPRGQAALARARRVAARIARRLSKAGTTLEAAP